MIPDIPDVFALIGFALSILLAPIYYVHPTKGRCASMHHLQTTQQEEGPAVTGFEYAQGIHDNLAGPDMDVCEGCEDEDCGACDGECCDSCHHGDHEEDPDDARDREYAYDDED